jgi:hypothetical protein
MFCYQQHFSHPTQPVDEAQFYALVRASQWGGLIDAYRQTGDARLKRRLPAFIFQATFDESVSKAGKTGRWRKQAATRLTGLVVMDIDHVENPRAVVEGWVMPEQVLLVYVTPSGKGLKVVFKADAMRGNLIDNQHWMAKRLGVEVDESCKDASRMSFICKEEDILFIDKELFGYENPAFGEMYDEEYRNGRSGSLKENGGEKTEETLSGDETEGAQMQYRGMPYSAIIERWWELNGGVPQEGERNVKLYQLAVNLRSICDNRKDLLLKVMPRLGLEEAEMERIVHSACKETPKGISNAIREIVGMDAIEALSQEEMMNQRLWAWGEQIEGLFEEFPVLKDVCKGLKKNQYPAAVFVAGGLMMTLMTRCTYRFYHRPEELRRLNNSTFVIGDPASGKSFATRLYKLLAAPIVSADKAGKEAINAYREEMRTKGANKEKPKKPKAVVRVHPARTSNAQFIQDMVNAVEVVDGEEMHLHMLTFDTELDNTMTVQKGGAWIDKVSLELKAFHNEEDGQAYSNNDSVFQEFNVFWNFIYTGTPLALKKKVNEQNFGSGLATRLTCIPLPATNFEMMKRDRDVDTLSDERLKEWAWRLDRTKGELPVQKLVDGLYGWTERRMADAKENGSRGDEMLLKRCAYHGLNFSAPFIMMRHWESLQQEGGFWCGTFKTDDTDWQLTEMMTNIQFACQRYFFGILAEGYFSRKWNEAATQVKHLPKTFEAFERLPAEFNVGDVMRCFNLSTEGAARTKIYRLTCDHLVEKIQDKRLVNDKVQAVYRKTGTELM